MKLKIVHLGDIQLEIRNSGKMSQRYGENLYVMQAATEYIKSVQPDIVVIAGDIYQFNAANGDETKMFGKFLHEILPHTKGIRIIPGNHDVKQRNNSIIEDAKTRNTTDFIDTVVSNISNHKIEYYQTSGLHIDAKFDITWAVWSQLDKWSAEENPNPYSPWETCSLDDIVTNGAIELYHDPIKGSLDFNSKIIKSTDEYTVSYGTFRCNTVLAGDIHSPMIYRNDKFTFTYCSSLIQRNFGEGSYYDNEKLVTDGNSKHGLNYVEFDTEQNIVTDVKFIPIKNMIGRHTVRLSENFNYDFIDTLKVYDEYMFHDIIIVSNGNRSDFIKNSDKLISHFKQLYNCNVELINDATVLEAEYADVLDATDKIATPEKIMELAKSYIDSAVDSTSMISDDMLENAKTVFLKLFTKEFEKIELESKLQHVKLQSADISNFMTFGPDVHVDFTNDAITRIVGSNAVGKTTLAYFVSWMYNDLISTGQNVRNKLANYTAYFNDRSESDTVSGKLAFNVNGDVHTLEKTLTRKWKRNKPMHFNENWRDFLSGTPSVQMTLTSDNMNSSDVDEITTYLKTNVITLSKFFSMMFINQNILDAMIHRKTELLNQSILSGLGLNFFDAMLNSYDTLREASLAKLSKPALTVKEYLISITEQEELIETVTETVKHVTEQLAEKQVEYDTVDKEKTALLTSLHNVRSASDIDISITDNAAASDTHKQHILTTQDNISKLEQSAADTIENIVSDISNITLRQSESTAANALLVQQHAASLQRETDLSASIKTLAQTVFAEINENLNVIDADIVTKTSEQTIADAKKIEAESKYLAYVNNANSVYITRLSELNDITNVLVNEANALALQKQTLNIDECIPNKTKIDTLSAGITSLEHSETCDMCKRKLDADALSNIHEKIQQYRTDSSKHQLKLDEALAKSAQIDQYVIDKNLEISNARTNVQKHTASKIAYPKLLTEASDLCQSDAAIQVIYNEYVKCIGIATEVRSDIAKLETLKITTTESNKQLVITDQRIIDARINIETVRKDTVTFTESIDACSITFNEISEELVAANTRLENRHALDRDLDQLQKNIDDLQLSINACDFKHSELSRELLHAKEDALTQDKIKLLSDSLMHKGNVLTGLHKQITSLEADAVVHQNNVTLAKDSIEAAKKYSLVESVLKLYKRMMSKSGLSQYVFEHIIPVLNSKLNELLDTVQFRLLFDKHDLSLKMIDITKNVIRPITFASGMESTILGLSLISVIRDLNNSTLYHELFIDELSGKLNGGEELPYSAEDYKRVFSTVIKRISKHANIVIVDHVIKDLGETRAIVVKREAGGSTAEAMIVKSEDDVMSQLELNDR